MSTNAACPGSAASIGCAWQASSNSTSHRTLICWKARVALKLLHRPPSPSRFTCHIPCHAPHDTTQEAHRRPRQATTRADLLPSWAVLEHAHQGHIVALLPAGPRIVHVAVGRQVVRVASELGALEAHALIHKTADTRAQLVE